MNKDQVKGAVNDAAGRVKRQAGEWTGDTDAQVEGAAQQAKGKAQKAWGNIKDAARGAEKDEPARQQSAGEAEEEEHEHAGQHHGR
jgi:uncharacterized protein YjbJ (UPF0337 family)